MKSIKIILFLSSLLLASSLWAVSVSGPTGTLQINSGAPYASSSDVVLTIKADDPTSIAGMQIANNTSYHDTEAYVETKNWTLTAGDGLKTLRVRFIDLFGNTTTPGILASITLDTTAPVLTLTGSSSINILQGDVYTDEGATASDNLDGDISARIVTTGLPVDTSTLGTTTISYDVSDSAGNMATSISRFVAVLATSTSTSTEPIIIPLPATTTPEQREERRSSSLVLGFNPSNLFTPEEENMENKREITIPAMDAVKLARLRVINEKLREINRELLMIKNPELKALFAEQDKILLNYILAQAEGENIEDEEETPEIPSAKPWWKIW